MTMILSPLAATLAPAAPSGARRQGSGSSDAFDRTFAEVSGEAALSSEAGTGAPTPEVPPGALGLLPDGAAHPEVPASPGLVVGDGGLAGLVGGVVPADPGAEPEEAPDDVLPSLGTDVVVPADVVASGLPGLVPPVAPDGAPGRIEGSASGQVSAAPGATDLLAAAAPSGVSTVAGAAVPGTAGPAGAVVTAQVATVLGVATGPGQSGTPGADAQGTSGPAAPVDDAGPVTGTPPTAPGGGGPVLPVAHQGTVRADATAAPSGVDGLVTQPTAPAGPQVPAGGEGGAAPTVPGAGAPALPEPTVLPGQVAPAPVQGPAPIVVAQAAPVAPAPQAAPTLHAQLSGPVFALVDAGDGDHVMTLSVTPENLGPVTVRALIAGGELRIELFAPHDAGREALRALAADLRRDLAGISPSASLSVSDAGEAPTQGQAGADGSGRRGEGQTSWGTPADPRPTAPYGPATGTTTEPTVDDRTPGAARRLDVLV